MNDDPLIELENHKHRMRNMPHPLTHNDLTNIKHKLSHHQTVVLTYDECRGMLDLIEEYQHNEGKDVEAIKEGITEVLKSATSDNMTVGDLKEAIFEILDNS